MKSIKQESGILAKKGDYITITKEGDSNLTKGKVYKVINTSNGWAGQAVSFIGDNGKLICANGFWWDFANKL